MSGKTEDKSQEDVSKMIVKCVEAKEMSYSPYSKFRVGAALLTKTGQLYGGCNIENVSYGLSMCAERVAIVKAASEGYREFKAMAITCDNNSRFLYPCGACRQFMAEFKDMDVYLVKGDGEFKKSSVKELLPLSFNKDDLNA